jgi:hypothetical protein
MFTRKPRLQLEKFAINGAKRLLQHNLPSPDIPLQQKTNNAQFLEMVSRAVPRVP